MGCDRPSATGWLKNTRRLISHHDFKIGCDPSSATGWLKIQGGSSPTVISELVVTPLLQQGGSKNTRWFMSHYDFKIGCGPLSASGWLKKYKVVYLPVWFSIWCDLLSSTGNMMVQKCKVVHLPLLFLDGVCSPPPRMSNYCYSCIYLDSWIAYF